MAGRLGGGASLRHRDCELFGDLVERTAHGLVRGEQTLTSGTQLFDLAFGGTTATEKVSKNLSACQLGFTHDLGSLGIGILAIGVHL